MAQNANKSNDDGNIKPTSEPQINYSLKDTFLFARNEIDAIHSETKAGLRKLMREAKYLWRGMDLVLLFLFLGVVLIAAFLISVLIIPVTLFFFPGSIFKVSDLIGFSSSMLGLWLDDTTLRIGVGAAGALGIAFRLLMKRDVEKFRDKVKSRENVTYVFGSSIYAEKFCHQMVQQYGYEEYIALISDQQYLWVENIAGLLDTYTMKNISEFEKENFYTMIGFENAKRIILLSDNVERNQAILTNIRGVRPDVPIFILSQYTPAFLESKLVEDKNIHIIDDLFETNRGLVTSLSLDISYPSCTEINVPRKYVGRSAEYITKDTLGVEVLAIRRPDIDKEGGSWNILPPTEKLQRTDRILCHFSLDFFMKKLNRIATELPVHPLVELGELKVDGKKNRITDLPERALFFEPMGSRRSWRRVILVIAGLLSIIISILIGRVFFENLQPISEIFGFSLQFDFIFFVTGLSFLIIGRLLHPISEKGIRILSKDDDHYLIKTKSWSLFGKDTVYSLSKLVNTYCLTSESTNERMYFFQFDNGEVIPFITVEKVRRKHQDYEVVLNRFETRLSKYTKIQLEYITKMDQIKPVLEIKKNNKEIIKNQEPEVSSQNGAIDVILDESSKEEN